MGNSGFSLKAFTFCCSPVAVRLVEHAPVSLDSGHSAMHTVLPDLCLGLGSCLMVCVINDEVALNQVPTFILLRAVWCNVS